MRWLFLIVLALNLVYITWQISLPGTASYTNVAPLKNVQPVILLSELKKAEPESSNEVELEPVQQDELIAIATVAEETKTEAAIEDLMVPVSTENKISEQKSSADKKSEPASKVAEPGAVPIVAAEAEAPKSENCFTLGPFRDLDKLRALTQEIISYVIKTDFRGSEEKEQSLYWVYIKPEKNRKKAIATGVRLKSKKIKDFYVIRDGEQENGLSLGRFKSKSGAYKLAKKVKKLGFEVTVEPLFTSHTIYWLDYQLASGVKIPESIFEKYIKSSAKDKISRFSRQCGA